MHCLYYIFVTSYILNIFFYALESDILRPILYPFLYTMGWKNSEIVCTLFSVFAGNIPISNPFIWCFMIKSTIPVGTNMLRRCSQTMLTRLWLFLTTTTYALLTLVKTENLYIIDIFTATFLFTSSCQRSKRLLKNSRSIQEPSLFKCNF